ncbi:MAG: tyrosine--tRNA ligase [Actinomycetota bacterium]
MDTEQQLKLIASGAEEIIPADELNKKLKAAGKESRPLRVKLGLDPSAPDIHLGHTVVLRKLRQFQDLGHVAVLIIGDFTGMIGDPSGRSSARQQLTEAEVKANAATYVTQLMKTLDRKKTEVVFNSSWLKKMGMADAVRLAGAYTVARMLERDDFARRYADNQPISIRELMYPLLQGYDSVAVKADVELGGTDQKFNLLVGRELQRDYGQEPQIVLMMPLLEGTDGINKMSKSLGNYIGVTDSAEDMFGKTMSIPDELIGRYFRLVTDTPPPEVDKIEKGLSDGTLHPNETKRRLAGTIAAMYHGDKAAEAAEEAFNVKHKVGHGGAEQLAEIAVPVSIPPDALTDGKIRIIDLIRLTGFASTNAEARRLVRQGAVKENGNRVTAEDAEIVIKDGTLLQAGKRKVALLSLE